jgi:hypothetical protein
MLFGMFQGYHSSFISSTNFGKNLFFKIFSTILARISSNVLGTRRFFVPDEKKCEAFLRAQKNVAEQKCTKG